MFWSNKSNNVFLTKEAYNLQLIQPNLSSLQKFMHEHDVTKFQTDFEFFTEDNNEEEVDDRKKISLLNLVPGILAWSSSFTDINTNQCSRIKTPSTKLD